MTFLGEDHVVVASYVGTADQPPGAAKWELARIHVDSGARQPIDQSELIEFVISIDASDDGRTLVASDAMGTTKRFRFDTGGKLIDQVTLDIGGVPLFIDVHPDGHRALIGGTMSVAADQDPKQIKPAQIKPGQMQIWNLEPAAPVKVSNVGLETIPLAGIQITSPIADNFQQAIVAADSRLQVRSIDQDGKLDQTLEQTLATDTGSTTRVAFSKADTSYQIAMARDGGELTDLFDLSQVKLMGRQAIDPARFVANQQLDDRWTAPWNALTRARVTGCFKGNSHAGNCRWFPHCMAS